MWKDRRFIDLVGIEHPIIQAPMAGANLGAMAIAVSQAGGLGSLPCAMLGPEQARAELEKITQQTGRPFNVNFFAHQQPAEDAAREQRWRQRLAPYYAELGVDADAPPGAMRRPFDAAMCDLVVAFRPKVVSFHFGLPAPALLQRLKAAGSLILSSATTVAEARWLEMEGADAIIAQGYEAGGHRGMFLTESLASQVGTMALVPQIVDAVRVPVIAAGGIGDGRQIAAALLLGACAVQVGSVYLLAAESTISKPHREALRQVQSDQTVLTNLMSGRPARGIVNRLIREVGPISADAPAFPLASAALAPLRAKAELRGSGDFSPLWAGQAAAYARETGAADITRELVAGARRAMG